MNRILGRILERLSLWFVSAYVQLVRCKYGLNKNDREQLIVVSMTSYPQRFETIVLPLKSLLLQYTKPDKIIVWLGSDSNYEMLTPEMKGFEKFGVEYRFDATKNLKPHKKYYYAMQEYAKELIITVDDDIIYPPTLVSSLIKTHKKFPNDVCARRVHQITLCETGEPKSYKEWNWECKTIKDPSNRILATNGAGTLFPPGVLHPEVFNVDKIIDLCLGADDIWLWFMEQLNGTKIVWAPCILVHPPQVRKTRGKPALSTDNIENNENDLYMKKLLEHYGDMLERR